MKLNRHYIIDFPLQSIRVSCGKYMVDIHCHLLSGLDDGADTFETSLQMAEMAIADGITHVIGTPHANSQYKFDPEVIRPRRDELQSPGRRRPIPPPACAFLF